MINIVTTTPLTIRAPCVGGLLISLRCNTDIWLLTLSAASVVRRTICSAPTRSPYNPAFFAKLCPSHNQHTIHMQNQQPNLPGKQASQPLYPRNTSQPTHPCPNLRSRSPGKRSRKTHSAFSRSSHPQSLSTAQGSGPPQSDCAHTRAGETPTSGQPSSAY